MTTISRLALTAVLLGCCAAVASAQTVTEIVDRHLAALGGRAALETLKSRSLTGTITLTTPAGDVSGTVEVLNQAPNKERTLINLDLSALGGGQMTVDQRFDGTAGYVMDTLQGNREITGTALENMKTDTFPSPFLDYAQRGLPVRLGGKEKVGDREAYVLIVEPKGGFPVRQYIDAESYLLTRAVATIDAPQIGQLEQTTELSDYRDVEGFKVPFAIKTVTSVQTVTVTITKAAHNVAIDPSLFSKPAN
jgi:outer membrane lipoprotein-sorting protein